MSRMCITVCLVIDLLGSAATGQVLDESGCRLTMDSAPSVYAQCSTLTVAENPDEPSRRPLELFVARIPALAAVATDDPLVLIAGGPGQSSVDLYLQLRNAFDPIRRQRDIVLMDQRGTGRSADGFECPVPEDLDFQTADPELLRELVAECIGGLSRDPRAFTTSIAVGDLELLREALGVAQLNLYGVSYGTRVAQHYLRRYPQRVRSAILDGVVPPDLLLGTETAERAQAALDEIFRRCHEDARCRERFGTVDEKFQATLRALRDGSRQQQVRVYPEHLLGVTRLMSYSAMTAALLPLVIEEAYHGRYATLLAQAEIFIGGVEQAISFPMHNAVACSEDIALIDDDDSVYGEGSYLGSTIMDALFTICADWPIGPVDRDFKELVVSDVPVLLLSGGNDPATPAIYAQHVINGGLTNSLHVIAADQGHGIAAIGCVPLLMDDFIDLLSPSAIDPSCVKELATTAFFLSTAGPSP